MFVSPQAVWAGWGHASENPKLPELLDKAGISFLGKELKEPGACVGDMLFVFILVRGIFGGPASNGGLTFGMWTDSHAIIVCCTSLNLRKIVLSMV